ncbi:hypothetical protein ACOME3_006347 [Neoechinorhynchus agilis]
MWESPLRRMFDVALVVIEALNTEKRLLANLALSITEIMNVLLNSFEIMDRMAISSASIMMLAIGFIIGSAVSRRLQHAKERTKSSMEKAIQTQFVEVIEVAEQETEMAGTDGFNEIIKEIAKRFRSYMKNYGKVDLKKTMENGIQRDGMKRNVKEELSNEMIKFVERFPAIQSMMSFEVYENDNDNGESVNEEMEIDEEFEEPGDVARESRKRKSDNETEIDSEKKRKRCFRSDQCEWSILAAEMKQLIVTNEGQFLNNAQRIVEFGNKNEWKNGNIQKEVNIVEEKKYEPQRIKGITKQNTATVEKHKSLRVKEFRKRTAGNINEESAGDWLSSLEELATRKFDQEDYHNPRKIRKRSSPMDDKDDCGNSIDEARKLKDLEEDSEQSQGSIDGRQHSASTADEDDRDGWGRSIDQFGELIHTEKDGEQPQGSMDGRQQGASTANEDDNDGWGRSIDHLGNLIDVEKDGNESQASKNSRKRCAETIDEDDCGRSIDQFGALDLNSNRLRKILKRSS